MTGTALTEEKEFRDIYGMDVVEIPTNRPVIEKTCTMRFTRQRKKSLTPSWKRSRKHMQRDSRFW